MKVEEGFMSDTPLNIPGGTYTPTQTTFITDAYGQQWATSMSAARLPNKQFGTHVWYRRSARHPWQFLYAFAECHGWLTVDRGKLQFIYNQPSMRGAMLRIIPEYRHNRNTPPPWETSQ
jgi:hypothetical protein